MKILLFAVIHSRESLSHSERCGEDRSVPSVAALCIITLGLLHNIVYLCDSDWQESAEM